jgi:GLPGLI family protein
LYIALNFINCTMRKILLSLGFSFVCTLLSFAQLTEGHISYKIDMTSDDPDMQMAIGMMQGSTLEVYFKDKTTRAEMKMGAIMNITTISNETSGDVLMLMSGMIGHNAIKTTTSELEKENTEKPKYDVQLVDETKTIEGYACKKAILTDEEGNESVFWYTEEIDISKKGQSYLNEDVPGFPMQYDLNNNGMKMTMTVSQLEKKLDKKSVSLFEMAIPEGYKEMTMEDLKSMGM